jgi:uncharacterized protein YneF (UPF0154 family)
MLELMGEMTLCLVIALLLGFLIGWLFSKALEQESLDESSEIDSDYIRQIKDLELQVVKEKKSVTEQEKKNKELKLELMKKMTLLKNTTDLLQASKNRDGESSRHQLNALRDLLQKKDRELAEFESVLIKAEETIEQLRG